MRSTDSKRSKQRLKLNKESLRQIRADELMDVLGGGRPQLPPWTVSYVELC